MSRAHRTVTDIENDARAVDLRRQNLTYRQIAEQLGYSSTSRAYEAVQRGLRDAIQEPADDLRRLELERLDEMARAAWKVLYDRHLAISAGGKVVRHPDTGAPLVDDGPTLAAIDRLLKIQERRTKLLGLDAPQRLEVLTLDAIDAEIRRLSAELGPAALGAADPTAGPVPPTG